MSDTQLSTIESTLAANVQTFELMQRQAKMYVQSDLVPKQFQGNIGNCVIALEMAARLGASPMAVMQNIYIVHGKPSWSSQFIIAAINQCGRYSPLRFDITGEGDAKVCVAWAIEKATEERLESPEVSIKMAKAEGWYQKNGSKWQTMPELMLRYRAATLFGRLYAPEILMGMRTQEEVEDIGERQVQGREIPDDFTPIDPFQKPQTEEQAVEEAPAEQSETLL